MKKAILFLLPLILTAACKQPGMDQGKDITIPVSVQEIHKKYYWEDF